MKCLSIQQPWAWAILHAGKDIENRTWWTRYRGPILLHASKRYDTGSAGVILARMDVGLRAHLPDGIPGGKLLPRGGIVGRAVLAGCVKHSDSPWFEGRFGLVLREVEALELFPWTGHLGLFDFPDELLPRLRPA